MWSVEEINILFLFFLSKFWGIISGNIYLFKVNNKKKKNEKKKWNMFKICNKDTRTTVLASFCCLYCKLWTNFSTFSSVSNTDFERVNVCWEIRSSCSVVSYVVPENFLLRILRKPPVTVSFRWATLLKRTPSGQLFLDKKFCRLLLLVALNR